MNGIGLKKKIAIYISLNQKYRNINVLLYLYYMGIIII